MNGIPMSILPSHSFFVETISVTSWIGDLDGMTELPQSLLPVYGTLPAMTFVLYDHMTTYDLEVDIIWKRTKWSIVQYLFMVNRYTGDIYMIYLAVGTWQGLVPGMTGMVLLSSMQYIMALPVICLYNRSRKIIILIVSALILEAVLMIVIYAVKNSIEGVANIRYVCTTFYASEAFIKVAFLNILPFICFELLVVILVGREAYRYSKGTRHGGVGSTNANLLKIIFRDSIVFPVITIIVCIFCSLSYSSLNEKPLGEFLSHQGIGVLCLLGPRLILNLRDAYYAPFNMEMEQTVVHHEVKPSGVLEVLPSGRNTRQDFIQMR
ncbi:hypothetical protein BJ165DRAFT_1612883 [Panaeolus papilionaceus]|nr:hypothetical protein BJ165DRAFT_1612883 [Panaeolus papilionaceus]